jgi:integrase
MAWLQKLQRKDGSCSYKAYWRDPDSRVRSKTFKRRRDADAFCREIEHEKDVGTYRDPSLGKVTLGDFWEHFIRTAGPASPSTRSLYEMQARVHLLPRLGGHRLQSISKPTVRSFLADLQEAGVRPPTVNAVYRLLRRVLNVAMDEGRIAVNPASRIDSLPRLKREEMRFLDHAQVRALSEEVPGRYKALILLLAYGGLRIGEAAALRVKNVDFLRSRVHIVEASKEVDGQVIVGETKTGRSRTVVLPTFLREELLDHLASFGQPSDPDSLVFKGPQGGPLRQHGFRSRVFVPAAKRLDLDRVRVHDLRHTAVALAIEAGWHPRKIQEMLGHSSIQVTMDRYGHLFDTLHEGDADRLDELYRMSSARTGSVVTLRAKAGV